MAPKVGDLVKLKGGLCVLFGGTPIGIIEEIYTAVSFDKEYKVRWATGEPVLREGDKSIQVSWLKPGDFEIISED